MRTTIKAKQQTLLKPGRFQVGEYDTKNIMLVSEGQHLEVKQWHVVDEFHCCFVYYDRTWFGYVDHWEVMQSEQTEVDVHLELFEDDHIWE